MTDVSELSIVIQGEFYNIAVGQEVRLSQIGEEQGFGQRDDVAVIERIEYNENPVDTEIYLKKMGGPHPAWEKGWSLTIWIDDFVRTFSLHESGPMVVNRDHMFKKTNLKGMRCKIIANLSSRDVFVEMEKDIGGGSCDGIGRKGYCIPIKREFLTPSKKKEKTKRRT